MLRHDARQKSLRDDHPQTDVREEIPDPRFIEREPRYEKNTKERGEERKSTDVHEVHNEEPASLLHVERTNDVVNRLLPIDAPRCPSRICFGKQEQDGTDIDECKKGSKPERRSRIEPRAVRSIRQLSAQIRPHDEPESERGADEPEVLRTILRRRHIRNHGLRYGNISAGDAVQHARCKEERNIVRDDRQSKEHVAHTRSGERGNQDWSAPVSIRHLSQNRRCEKLHDRITGSQCSKQHVSLRQ